MDQPLSKLKLINNYGYQDQNGSTIINSKMDQINYYGYKH